MTGPQLLRACQILMDAAISDLEIYGVLTAGADNNGSEWRLYRRDPVRWMLNLPPDRLEKLADMINTRMPAHLRETA